MAKAINAIFEDNHLGKPRFRSSNGVSFIIESCSDETLIIRTLSNQPIWSIAKMASGFTQKDSNMFGAKKFYLIIGNENALRISLYDGIPTAEIVRLYRQHLLFEKK